MSNEQVICSDGTVLLPGQWLDNCGDNIDFSEPDGSAANPYPAESTK